MPSPHPPHTQKETSPTFSFSLPTPTPLTYFLCSFTAIGTTRIYARQNETQKGSRRAWDRNGARESMNVHVNSWTVVS